MSEQQNQQQPNGNSSKPTHYIKMTLQPDGTVKRTRTRDRGAKQQQHKQPDCEREPAGGSVMTNVLSWCYLAGFFIDCSQGKKISLPRRTAGRE